MSKFDSIPLGWALHRRIKHLQDLSAAKSGSTHTVQLKFRNRLDKFPVYVVPLDLPKYRLENGRTQAAQENYLALAKPPKPSADFFRQDKESDQAQRVQHELLFDMIGKNNLLNYFKDSNNKQTEPLILSHEGYVVNGNRRLCAMRTLYYGENKEKYSHFKDIDVIILPVCTAQDIDELEAYLQVQQDIKADYPWIAEACMLRARQQEHGYSHEMLSDIYGKTVNEIKLIIQRLGFVDEYLKSIKKEKQYHIVEQNENAFKQIQKVRQQIKEEDLKELVTQMSYVLIENSDDVSGRLYERIPDLKENLNEITKRLSEEIQTPKATKQEKGNYDLFGSQKINISPLTTAVAKPENKTKVIDIAIDVIDGQKEKQRQKKKIESVLSEVSEANAHLQNAINYLNEKNVSKTGVFEHITAIEDSINIIKKWLSEDD
jgi:hypothetical protein